MLLNLGPQPTPVYFSSALHSLIQRINATIMKLTTVIQLSL